MKAFFFYRHPFDSISRSTLQTVIKSDFDIFNVCLPWLIGVADDNVGGRRKGEIVCDFYRRKKNLSEE
jgi:hypothetical protein